MNTFTQDERRSEPRVPAPATPASVIAGQPVPRTIAGTLQDRSSRGFRLAHLDPDLVAGERVSFQIEGCSGTAIVAWKRILRQHIECGFLIERSED